MKVDKFDNELYLHIYQDVESILSILQELKLLSNKYKDLPMQKHLVLKEDNCWSLKDKKMFVISHTNEISFLKSKNIKELKRKCHNYYCDNFIKNFISVFGNERAKEEFEIEKVWDPEINILSLDNESFHYFFMNSLTWSSLLNVRAYSQSFLFCWNKKISNVRVKSMTGIFANSLVNIKASQRSRRKLSMLVSKNQTSHLLNRFYDDLTFYSPLLSKDGQDLLRDLEFIKNLS